MSSLQYLKVVVCFLILTDLTKFLLKFCVDEVFEDRGAVKMRRIKRGKSSSLGIPKAPQVNIPRILKHLSLGMPRLASHLSSSTIIGTSVFVLFTWFVSFVFFFFFKIHASVRWPSSIYRILNVLHLYLLRMIL